MVSRFDVYMVNLDTEVSKNVKNTRPCVILSPDEMNKHLSHVTIAPISSSSGKYPTRISVELLNNERFIVLDQIRTVDKERLVKQIGQIGKAARKITLDRLQEMFAE